MPDDESQLDKFQLEEYRNISNAHFETNKQIGEFFRHFLLIASAPALIYIWFGKDENFLKNILNGRNTENNLFIGIFLIIISIIGLFSCFYLISLRLDSILYARSVNGVRKYFYNKKNEYEEKFRVLPKNINQPKYFDFHTFGILVYSIAIIDSVYFALGTRIIASVGDDFFLNYLYIKPIITSYNFWWSTCVFFIFGSLHIIYYKCVSNYRHCSYMKSSIIGIDIDGVLNKHRNLFCQLHLENLRSKYGESLIPDSKKLEPDEIIKMPVSLIPGKDISKDDEFDVFNNPKYWINQELISEDVSKIIQELKNSSGYKIFIHSHRPWPQYAYGKLLNVDAINSIWVNSPLFWHDTKLLMNKKRYLFFKSRILENITKQWLKENNVPFNKLFIESSNIDSSKRSRSLFGLMYNISKSNFKNRYYYTNKNPYRYFIEDNPENALKLASNCEYVFLIEQPYNTETNFVNKLPQNVIRVKSWDEIKNKIAELG